MSRVYVAPISFGLGDLVVSLPVVQALIEQARRTGGETWLVARSSAQTKLAERIEGLGGCVDEDTFDARAGGDRFVDLRDHPLQRDYWWGSPEFEQAFGPLSINEILGRICADFGIDAKFTRPVPLTTRPRPKLRSSVLFVTESDGPSKRWSAENWASLAQSIRNLGLDVRLVTRDEVSAEMRAAGIEATSAPTPGDAIDVLSACRAVIGIDTGLTHIAVQQGSPTVTICRANTIFLRPWPHARAVTGGQCDDACTSLEKDYAYNERVSLRGFRWQPRTCPVGGRCLDPVQPADVLRTLGELL
ncbi:MAG: glycosyltransferase family 9 protein [Actinobacteria bacterium]|nr:MAG: glycosyltransferase family 9 protein [Actinomycetota bacterium]